MLLCIAQCNGPALYAFYLGRSNVIIWAGYLSYIGWEENPPYFKSAFPEHSVIIYYEAN